MLTILCLIMATAVDPLPEVHVRADNTVVSASCRLIVDPAVSIADADGNGVIHVTADGVTIEFADGSALRGAPPGVPWDEFVGIGIRIEGRKGVTIRGARVHGFKTGVLATACDGLTVESCDLSDNYRQRLRSTPAAEDASDWLWPHENDAREWVTRYGAALCVERSTGVTLRRNTVRRGQNGIMLDRVEGSKVYDNDCSFLSGWGLSMWRSSKNMVSRNAFDFCVRGHSEGVYNRGQDSAGILVFEQCNRNTFSQNSATHSGDGFFGFAGREALGERPPADPSKPVNYARVGCNNNLIIENDLSYAPTNGVELTFSEYNGIVGNRIVGNAEGGIWAGFCGKTLILQNVFEENGGAGPGVERGAVRIEHGSENRIIGNRFVNNRSGVHLWWDDDPLRFLPGAAAGYAGVSGNVVARNAFVVDRRHPFRGPSEGDSKLVSVRIRDLGTGNVRTNLLAENTFSLEDERAVEIEATPGSEFLSKGKVPPLAPISAKPEGETRPVGARAALQGRGMIVMGEWGPWDHASPLVRFAGREGGADLYDVFGVPDAALEVTEGSCRVEARGGPLPGSSRFAVVPSLGGVSRYRGVVRGGGFEQTVEGTLVATAWDVAVFASSVDPVTELDAWRRLAAGTESVRAAWRGELRLPLGYAGPRGIAAWSTLGERLPAGESYGLIATTRLALPAGSWRFTVMSDDGVRVRVRSVAETGGERTLIERWDHHAPTQDEAVHQADGGEVEVTVEYFQLRGFAVLGVAIEPDR